MTAFQLLLFTYAATILVTIGFGNGERLAIHIIKFLLIALLGAVAFSCVFTDLDELMQSLVIVMTVQALIIFLFIFNSTLQVFFFKSRPRHIRKIKLCIGKLPHQIIGKSLLSARANQQIRVWNPCRIKIIRKTFLRNLLRQQLPVATV